MADLDRSSGGQSGGATYKVAGPLTSLDQIASIVEDPPSDPGQRLRAVRTCEPELIAATR